MMYNVITKQKDLAVEAYARGDFAIHKPVDPRHSHLWSISLIDSGLEIMKASTKEEARFLADYIANELVEKDKVQLKRDAATLLGDLDLQLILLVLTRRASEAFQESTGS